MPEIYDTSGNLINYEILAPMRLELINSKMTLVEVMNEQDLDNEIVFYNSISWALEQCKSKETAD